MGTPRTCTVYIQGADGARYGTNVSAASSHEAARLAIDFFNDGFWKGPKPNRDTVLEIAPMNGPLMRVRVGSVVQSKP